LVFFIGLVPFQIVSVISLRPLMVTMLAKLMTMMLGGRPFDQIRASNMHTLASR